MSYIVMECHPGYVVLLDEEGRFVKAANFQYEVGQTVHDPVLLRERTPGQGHRIRLICGGFAAIAACFLLFFGIGYYRDYIQPYSSVYLTINPEVRMELNRHGTVVRLTGTNADGEQLLDGYDGSGKDKVTVADELLDRAIVMGFLSEGGQVSIAIDTPDEALFRAYGVELRSGVETYLSGRLTVTIFIFADGESPVGETAAETTTQPEETSETPVSTPSASAGTSASPSASGTSATAAPASSAAAPAVPSTTAPTAPPATAPTVPSTTAPTAPPTTPAPAQPPAENGDSGYGDSGYGDSGYEEADDDDD